MNEKQFGMLNDLIYAIVWKITQTPFSNNEEMREIVQRAHDAFVEPEPSTTPEREISKPEHTSWKPEAGEYYWNILGDGSVRRTTWQGVGIDHERWLIGNTYPCDERAIYERNRRQIIVKMRRWARERFIPDWENPQQLKLILQYDHKLKEWYFLTTRTIQYSDWPVFADKLDFENFITTFDKQLHYLLERPL